MSRDRDAFELRAALSEIGIGASFGTVNGLIQRDRFTKDWIPLLLERARSMNARRSWALLSIWLRTGGWAEQILFVMTGRIGLFDTLSDGGRFNRCRELRERGLRPWLLAAIWNGARRIDHVRNPRAFVGAILKEGTWAAFAEEVRRREQSREITNEAVTTIVAEIIRRMEEKEHVIA